MLLFAMMMWADELILSASPSVNMEKVPTTVTGTIRSFT